MHYNLARELGSVDLTWLVLICHTKIAKERREHIVDILNLLSELEHSSNLSIDNLSFLKEVLQEVQKYSCLEKVVAFEIKRQHAVLAVHLQPETSVQYSRPVVIAMAAGGDVASPSNALEQKDGGMNFVSIKKVLPAVLYRANLISNIQISGHTSSGSISTIKWAAGKLIGGEFVKCTINVLVQEYQ